MPMQQDATGCNYAFSRNRIIDRYCRSRNELTERQRTAVEFLLQGFSDQDIAAHLHVDRTTIFRWRKSIAFARELDRARSRQRERVIGRIQSLVPSAFDVLQKQLVGDDPRLAMRAASILLRFATPARLATAAPDAEKQLRDEHQRHTEDLLAFIDGPLPGQPGAPQNMRDALDDNDPAIDDFSEDIEDALDDDLQGDDGEDNGEVADT